MKKKVKVTTIKITLREDVYGKIDEFMIKNGLVEHLGCDREDISINSEVKEMEEMVTLREYINANASGAYHNFVFRIMGQKVDVCGVHEFERIFRPELLDHFIVVDDKQEEIGNNCENYHCTHNLTIRWKGEKR